MIRYAGLLGLGREVWDLTPAELNAQIQGSNERQRESYEAAWLTAALMRAKRLPSLKKLLGPGQAPRAPVDREAEWRAIKEKFGEK